MFVESTGKLHINLKARDWCLLPYPDHPKGCPNYNNNKRCPPQVQTIEEFLSGSTKTWLCVVFFDLETHINKMQSIHPNWSYRQCRCLLYWQGGVNKRLGEETITFAATLPNSKFTLCPEAMGVNIMSTLWDLGIPIERNPQKLVHKVALIAQ